MRFLPTLYTLLRALLLTPAVAASWNAVLPPPLAECDWNHAATGTPQAWELLARRGILPGQDILIAHPDVGYQLHPEMQTAGQSQRGWRLAGSYDFVDRDRDPQEIPIWYSPLAPPSHSTNVASVITSPSGTPQGSLSCPHVSGLAPWAQVLPLRAAQGIIIWRPHILARAIDYAVAQKAQVIAITSGTAIPSDHLNQALARAKAQGVIVVAAAGNGVPFVVWPAASPHVLAVAASNPQDEPWLFSSFGKAVDISAPGAWVTVASNDAHCPQKPCAVTHSSFGTTLATAHVAAVAALWLSYHQPQKLLDCYGAATMVDTFYTLVKQHGFRRPKDWPNGGYGPGIIHAGKLLAAPMPRCQNGEELSQDVNQTVAGLR